MLSDPSFNWSLANPYGIQVDDSGSVWHAGCIRDVLIARSGTTLVASDTGGVWSVSPASATSLADLDPPDLSCLAQGPRADDHAFAGGSALYETDVTQGIPLLAWNNIPIVDASNASLGVGRVFRIGVTRERRRLVIATDIGVFWAEMTYPSEEPPGCLGALLGLKPTPKPPPPYAFKQIPFLPVGAYFGLAMGPGDSVAVAPWGDGSNPALSGLAYIDSGGMPVRATLNGLEFRTSDMRATTLAACSGNPNIMYGISSDKDGFFLGWFRSEDGGKTWRKKTLNVTNLPAGKAPRDILGNQGSDSRPCNCIAVSPNNADVAAIVWRHEGVLVTTDGGKHWEMREGAPHVHSDLHTVLFDPRDQSDLTLLVGGDGGISITTDQCRSFDSSMNRQLPNLQFQSYPTRFGPGSFSGSRFVPGLIAGGLQDNGNVVSIVESGSVTPWRRFGRADDGLFTTCVENQRTLYYYNDDPNLQSVAWDPSGKPKDHTWDMLRGVDPAGPVLVQSLVISPLRAPGNSDATGHRMYGLGARNTVLYAYLSKDNGTDGYWERLADFGVDFSNLSAAGSFNGRVIFVGTVNGELYRFDLASRSADKLGIVLKTAAARGTIHRILALSDTEFYAAYNPGNGGYLLQYIGGTVSEMGNGIPSSDWFYGLEAYSDANQRLVLLAASDSKVYVTRDRGASWLDASSALPRRPHNGDLSYVHQGDGNDFIYLSTSGRSVWVTQVTFAITVPPR